MQVRKLPNGDKYVGHLGPSGFVNGEYTFDNNDFYVGSFSNGQKHGLGTYFYRSTGEKYEGDWVNDLWDGKGTYSVGNPPEVIIKGTWSKGLMNGPAEVIHRNGDRFVGQYRNNRKYGKGILYYQSGSILEAEYIDD